MKDINLIKPIILSLLLLTVCSYSYGQQKKYNVLFIAIDDLNDYVSLLEGYPGLKTPNLDRFAQTSLTFSHAYCAAPVCNPSRVALLTGRSPANTGVIDNTDGFQKSPEAVSSTLLPELFKQQGYTTMWSGKIFHSRPAEQRLNAMWDDMEGHDGGYGPIPTVDNVTADIMRPPWFNYQQWTGPDKDFPDVVNSDLTIQRLQKKHEKPFFMALGLYRPHNPWTAPTRFFDMYPLEDVTLPKVVENDLDDVPKIGREWAGKPVNLDTLQKIGQWKPVLRSYLASISFMDYNLGRVLKALDESAYRDNTIVVLWADNGFHMGEKHHFAKYALWEKTTRVLMMIRVPGMKTAGKVQEQPVNLLDIYPTLVELCDLQSPAQALDGISLMSLIEDENAIREQPAVTVYQQASVGIRTADWRYIRYGDDTEELYHEEDDPNEINNLAHDPTYDQIKQNLLQWIPENIQKKSVPNQP